MAEEVVKEVWVPVSEVIRRVRGELEETLAGQQELLQATSRELGSGQSLEQRMHRARGPLREDQYTKYTTTTNAAYSRLY